MLIINNYQDECKCSLSHPILCILEIIAVYPFKLDIETALYCSLETRDNRKLSLLAKILTTSCPFRIKFNLYKTIQKQPCASVRQLVNFPSWPWVSDGRDGARARVTVVSGGWLVTRLASANCRVSNTNHRHLKTVSQWLTCFLINIIIETSVHTSPVLEILAINLLKTLSSISQFSVDFCPLL